MPQVPLVNKRMPVLLLHRGQVKAYLAVCPEPSTFLLVLSVLAKVLDLRPDLVRLYRQTPTTIASRTVITVAHHHTPPPRTIDLPESSSTTLSILL
jgi:hypothetical protein